MNRMTEETPIRPVSIKGAVRAEIAGMLMDAINKKEITALIARSADFISDRNSVLVEMGFKNLQKGKPAMWFVDADKIHNYTVSTDAAKATALLGNSPGAYNQVWHLPTDSTPLTGRQWVKMMADELNSEPKITILQTWMISLLGLFIPVLREFKEMLYQYDRDYFFDSSKFEKHFSLKPTTPKNAIKMLHSRLKMKKSDGGNVNSRNNTKDTVVNMK
jgi:nucleoside-diphosphate-sugar epimerase